MSFIKRIKEKPIYEYLIAVFVFVCFSIAFANITGILNSGYHLVDDHEIIDINSYIVNNGFLNALSYYVIDDLIWRYRPLFFIVRVIRAGLFGTNFYFWHLSVAIECGLYMAFSYILARKLKADILPSIIFSFVWLIGTQDEIIWRMGTQENMGMVFLGLSFILAHSYFENGTKKLGIAMTISATLMMMCKESFLVLGPSVILFLFYLYVSNNDEDKNIFIKLWDFIKKYKVFIIIVCLFVLISLGIIVFYVGLMDQGYAGIDTSYTIPEYIRMSINVFLRDLKEYWALFAIMALEFIYTIVNRISKKEFNRKLFHILLVGFVLIAYSLGIEAVLHAKSSIFDRYKLPCIWFIYLSLIALQNKRVNKYINYAVAIFALTIVIFFYNQKDANVYEDGQWYAKDGKQTTEMFRYIGSLKEKKQDLVVLTDYMWYEHNISSSMYLQLQEGVNSVYYKDDDRTDGNYKKEYRNDGTTISYADADVLITDDNKIDNYNLEEFNVSRYSWFYVLEKK